MKQTTNEMQKKDNWIALEQERKEKRFRFQLKKLMEIVSNRRMKATKMHKLFVSFQTFEKCNLQKRKRYFRLPPKEKTAKQTTTPPARSATPPQKTAEPTHATAQQAEKIVAHVHKTQALRLNTKI